MSLPAKVLINAAGKGSRLGLGLNKALIKIDKKTLIEWQLLLLPRDVEVVIGIGYQREDVVSSALQVRDDIQFVFNPHFESSGTASTLTKSAQGVRGRIVSLDVDLMVEPRDLRLFIDSQIDLVGTLSPQTTEPVYATVETFNNNLMVTGFERATTANSQVRHEWSGLVNIDAEYLRGQTATGHVYEMLESKLPLRAEHIRAQEVDFLSELSAFENWTRKLIRKHL